LFPAIDFGGVVIAIPVGEGFVVCEDRELTSAKHLAKFKYRVNDRVEFFFGGGPTGLDV
jgi:hypothetical protein